ncbi:MAG: zinc-ribbon domain-containing protein [Asgard group archaeon]|nr:zinc-ribbon domain-containing protein [Asgard group archaeon]
MVKCEECGKELRDESKFCDSCGKRVISHSHSTVNTETNSNSDTKTMLVIITIVLIIAIVIIAYVANETKIFHANCEHCDGTGECQSCSGSGFWYYSFPPYVKECTSCDGTGDCRWCDGTGKVD